MEALMGPWPWWIVGPLIGLMVPLLRLVGGKSFGISSNLQHLCAATVPGRAEYLRYDWWRTGAWGLTFAAGVAAGGFLAVHVLSPPDAEVAIAAATRTDLAAIGVTHGPGLVPAQLFSWRQLERPVVLVILLGGGFLVGFGARYADGCTSGHAITGLSDLQLPSLIAVVGFFAGGLISAHVILPWLLRSM